MRRFKRESNEGVRKKQRNAITTHLRPNERVNEAQCIVLPLLVDERGSDEVGAGAFGVGVAA